MKNWPQLDPSTEVGNACLNWITAWVLLVEIDIEQGTSPLWRWWPKVELLLVQDGPGKALADSTASDHGPGGLVNLS